MYKTNLLFLLYPHKNDKLEIPEHKRLCIRLKGYDFCVLDAYAKLIKKKSLQMGFNPKVLVFFFRITLAQDLLFKFF